MDGGMEVKAAEEETKGCRSDEWTQKKLAPLDGGSSDKVAEQKKKIVLIYPGIVGYDSVCEQCHPLAWQRHYIVFTCHSVWT